MEEVTYDVGERVLCFHRELLYEAKILKVQQSKDLPGMTLYRIHYKGWKIKWDEWVTSNRLRKWTEPNLAIQAQMKAERSSSDSVTNTNSYSTSHSYGSTNTKNSSHPNGGLFSSHSNSNHTLTYPSSHRKNNTSSHHGTSSAFTWNKDPGSNPKPTSLNHSAIHVTHPSSRGSSKREFENSASTESFTKSSSSLASSFSSSSSLASSSSSSSSSSFSNSSNSKRRKTENENEKQSNVQTQVTIPELLRIYLVEDWENVSRHQQIVPLPRSPNVEAIFRLYKQHKNLQPSSQSLSDDICREVVDGLQLYFNRALGTLLLYRFERQQYLDITRKYPDKALSELYGGEHLLRLFVRLPPLLNHTKVDPETILTLRDQINDLIEWFTDHRKEFLLHEYENPTPEYLNLSKAH